jgi:hypothetical protein
MTAFHRTFVPLLCVILAATPASTCAAKPTHDQIIALTERCKNEKKRMDLVAELGVDFSGLDLSGVDFRGYHAVGYETNLRSADFSNCNLHRAEFGAAILDGADFTSANLEPWLHSAVVLLQIDLFVAIWHVLRSVHPSRVAPASEAWSRGGIVDVAPHE